MGQSFNTSLPQQFVKNSQATSVIEHRVLIGSDLATKVTLNKHPVTLTSSEFQKNKQVGPLLEWVASLRYCVGYPDPSLVENARYLFSKLPKLPNAITKICGMIVVDDDFGYRRNEVDLRATLRAHSCHYVAINQGNVCDQCKL